MDTLRKLAIGVGLFVGFITAIVLVAYVRDICITAALKFRLRRAWAGRYIAFMAYSNNPKWAPYIAEHVLPKIGDATLVIDRSQSQWKENYPLEARAISHWGHGTEYNPILIVLTHRRRPRVFRMYEPFLEALKGRSADLERMVTEATEAVRSAAASANNSLQRP